MKRLTLTEHLARLEAEASGAAAAPESFSFAGGRYTIRVANDAESRRSAYELIYRLYREKEYAQPNRSGMWLSIFDALPETATLLVEKTAVEGGGWKVEGRSNPTTSTFHHPPSTAAIPVGALTVVFDSAMGLPADKVYGPELDALRGAGRRLAEVVSLGVAEDGAAGSQALVKLFNFAYFVARGLREATDFVITVNPRHVRFYERLMLFSQAGPERDYDKVGGAPAVLMRLDFDVAEQQRVPSSSFLVPGSTRNQEPGTRNHRTIYGQFRAVHEDPETVLALGRLLRPMGEREFVRFFASETDVLAEATPEQRAWIQRCYAPAGQAGCRRWANAL